jgi:hypothetical protein
MTLGCPRLCHFPSFVKAVERSGAASDAHHFTASGGEIHRKQSN